MRNLPILTSTRRMYRMDCRVNVMQITRRSGANAALLAALSCPCVHFAAEASRQTPTLPAHLAGIAI